MITTFSLWCLVVPAVVQEPIASQEVAPEAAAVAQNPEDLFDAIEEEYDAAHGEYRTAYRAADEADRAEIRKTMYPDADEYADRFLALAEQHAGTETAGKSLLWVARRASDDEKKSKAIGILVADHIDDPTLGSLCSLLERRYQDGETHLRRILENSPHVEVKGQACFALAKHLMNLGEMASTLEKGDDDVAQRYASFYGEDTIKAVMASSPATLTKKAETLFVEASEQYGDAPYRDTTVAAMSERNLFQLRNLQIGKVAPDIEGEDIDGVPFKLSDYRGKVVVLDFWGHW